MFLCSSLSMMLTMEENERVIDLLEGREPTADMTPFKRRRVDTLTVYRWKYLDEDGNELKKSNETFLDKKECLGQGRVAREHGVLRWESSEVPIPTVEQLVKTVYAYMLERRVNQRCYGCIHDKSSPTDHMGGGCQGEKENVVYWHARPCHLRISSTLLWEAVNIMNEYFKIGRVDRCHVVLCLEHCHPKETFLKDDDDFYYEYYNLDEL